MVNLKYTGVLMILAAVLFSSCVEEIDIELDSTYTRLVVDGKITTGNSIHTVKLTSTTDYFYTEAPPAVPGAEVRVQFDDIVIEFVEDPLSPGHYRNTVPFAGIPGKTYELTINGVDIDGSGEPETYTAETTMPEFLYVDSIQAEKFISPFFSGYQVTFFGLDPPGAQYYSFKLIRNNRYVTDRISEYTVQSDDFFGEDYIVGFPVGFLDDENETEFVLPGDTVALELNSIPKGYHDFILEAQNEIFGNNPLFSGPPANVSSNISNGAMGYFVAYTIDRYSLVIGQ